MDGAPDTTWTASTAARDAEIADDHINLKALSGDPSGRLFAAAKTSLNNPNDPIFLLLVLKPDGTWTRKTIWRVSDGMTRAQVVLDRTRRQVYVVGAAPCCSGGTIHVKQAALDNPSFTTGLGTPLIQSIFDTTLNNPTTTKQEVGSLSDALVVAGDDNTHYYEHNLVTLTGADVLPPQTSIDAGPSGVVASASASFSFSSDEAGATFSCSLDGAPFSVCASGKACAARAGNQPPAMAASTPSPA